MRSAAALSAATIAAWVLLERSAAVTRASCRVASSVLEPSQAQAHFGEFVGHHERRHHGEARIADLAEFLPQAVDANIEVARKVHQMALLAILTSHAELPPVDRDADLGHYASPKLRYANTHIT